MIFFRSYTAQEYISNIEKLQHDSKQINAHIQNQSEQNRRKVGQSKAAAVSSPKGILEDMTKIGEI